MKYRNFNILITPSNEVKRYSGKGEFTFYSGYLCDIYKCDDALFENSISKFSLAIGKDIPDNSYSALVQGITNEIDENYSYYDNQAEQISSLRKDTIISRLTTVLHEELSDNELYSLLSSVVGMTDDEIRQAGCFSLVKFFDRDCYAETIADYIIQYGAEQTLEGNYCIPISEISEKYGIDLSEDTNMLEKICNAINNETDMVADLDIEDGAFDICYYLSFCPRAKDKVDEEETFSQPTM